HDLGRGRHAVAVRPVRRPRPRTPAGLEVAPVRRVAGTAHRLGAAALDANPRRPLHAMVVRRRTAPVLAGRFALAAIGRAAVGGAAARRAAAGLTEDR